MRTRIIKNKPAGDYTVEWVLINKDKFINGQIVSEWELADLYTKDYINPYYNGSEWIESATQEEIKAHNQQIETAQKKIERETLLKSGIVVDNFWFNEYYLAQFISLIGVCERENKQIEWKNTNDNWETLLVPDANKIAFNASVKFQQIYKNI